jgi:inosose dehydratase
MSAQRVLTEVCGLGLEACEAGPPGFWPEGSPLRLVGGFLASADMDEVERHAAWLARRGAEVLVFAAAASRAGYEDPSEPDPATWRAVALAQDVGREHGMQLAVHPHFGTRIETRQHVQRLLHVTTAGLCVDTGHMLLGGADPLEVPIERVALVHLKDVDGGLAERVRGRQVGFRDAVQAGLFRPLGDGDARIAKVIRVLRDRGYKGWWVLEQDTVLKAEPALGQGPLEQVRRSLEFLRGV